MVDPHRMRRLIWWGCATSRVHLYEDIDDGRLHESLRTGRDDFDRFARAIASLL